MNRVSFVVALAECPCPLPLLRTRRRVRCQRGGAGPVRRGRRADTRRLRRSTAAGAHPACCAGWHVPAISIPPMRATWRAGTTAEVFHWTLRSAPKAPTAPASQRLLRYCARPPFALERLERSVTTSHLWLAETPGPWQHATAPHAHLSEPTTAPEACPCNGADGYVLPHRSQNRQR